MRSVFQKPVTVALLWINIGNFENMEMFHQNFLLDRPLKIRKLNSVKIQKLKQWVKC